MHLAHHALLRLDVHGEPHGAQTIDIDPRTDWRSDLQVGPIEPAAVSVSAYGDAARLTPGTAAEVSGLRVELVSVSGSDVSLRVDRA